MSDYVLCHHGIKGQKWGVRRFQKKDGSLTPAGRKRYSDEDNDDNPKSVTNAKVKKAVIVGAAVAGVTVAAYGGYKYSKIAANKKAVKNGAEAVTKTADKVQKSFHEMSAKEKADLMGYQEYLNGKLNVMKGPDGRPLSGEAAAAAYANKILDTTTMDQLKSKFTPSREQQSKIFETANILNSGQRTGKSFHEMSAKEKADLMGYQEYLKGVKDGTIDPSKTMTAVEYATKLARELW